MKKILTFILVLLTATICYSQNYGYNQQKRDYQDLKYFPHETGVYQEQGTIEKVKLTDLGSGKYKITSDTFILGLQKPKLTASSRLTSKEFVVETLRSEKKINDFLVYGRGGKLMAIVRIVK